MSTLSHIDKEHFEELFEMKSDFTPTIETAKISLQVLRAAIVSLENRND